MRNLLSNQLGLIQPSQFSHQIYEWTQINIDDEYVTLSYVKLS